VSPTPSYAAKWGHRAAPFLVVLPTWLLATGNAGAAWSPSLAVPRPRASLASGLSTEQNQAQAAEPDQGQAGRMATAGPVCKPKSAGWPDSIFSRFSNSFNFQCLALIQKSVETCRKIITIQTKFLWNPCAHIYLEILTLLSFS
jgi:hypothetical protein